MSNYLYVIRCNDRFKIGIASDVNARLASLQTGNPYQLSVVYCYEFDNAFPVEQSLHQKFSLKRNAGEWFTLEDSDLNELIEICTLLGGKPILGNLIASEDDIQEAEVIGEDWQIKPDMIGDPWVEVYSPNGRNYYRRWRCRVRVDGQIRKVNLKYFGNVKHEQDTNTGDSGPELVGNPAAKGWQGG